MMEWCPGKDYVHPEGLASEWISSDHYADLEDSEKARYTEWFSLSDTPVDGWVPEGADDYLVSEVQARLDGISSAILERLEELEAK